MPGVTPVQRHTALRGFDLKTGKEKLHWNLPGDNTTCNDFSVGPDKALYISDTGNARIYRLAPGASSAELWLEHRNLTGIDGITFLNGVLYIQQRVLQQAVPRAGGRQRQARHAGRHLDGCAGEGPRRHARRRRQAVPWPKTAAGKIDALTINGDTAHVTVLKDGLKTPTAVEPAGDTLWIAERGAGKVVHPDAEIADSHSSSASPNRSCGASAGKAGSSRNFFRI